MKTSPNTQNPISRPENLDKPLSFFESRIWTGTTVLPSIGQLVEVKLPHTHKPTKGFVVERFETQIRGEKELLTNGQSPLETRILNESKTSAKTYNLGLCIEMVELPDKLEKSVLGHRLLDTLKSRGPKTLLEFVRGQKSTLLYAYGHEIDSCDNNLPSWYEKYQLGAKEELLALFSLIVDQENDLDNQNHCEPKNPIGEEFLLIKKELDKIAMKTHTNFIKWVASKHRDFISLAKKTNQLSLTK